MARLSLLVLSLAAASGIAARHGTGLAIDTIHAVAVLVDAVGLDVARRRVDGVRPGAAAYSKFLP